MCGSIFTGWLPAEEETEEKLYNTPRLSHLEYIYNINFSAFFFHGVCLLETAHHKFVARDLVRGIWAGFPSE